MNKNLRRGVVALTTTFACLAMLASPASAATLTADITGGTVTLINSGGTVTDTIPLGPGVTALGTDCANNVTVVVNNTATSTTTWQITAYATISRFQLGTTWYIADLQRTASTAGTVTAVTTTTATLNAATLSLDARIYNTTFQSATDTACTKSTIKCRFANVALSLQGAYAGNIHTPAASHTATLNGSGTLGTTTPPCTTPFTTYNGGTVTVANLVAHVLTA